MSEDLCAWLCRVRWGPQLPAAPMGDTATCAFYMCVSSLSVMQCGIAQSLPAFIDHVDWISSTSARTIYHAQGWRCAHLVIQITQFRLGWLSRGGATAKTWKMAVCRDRYTCIFSGYCGKTAPLKHKRKSYPGCLGRCILKTQMSCFEVDNISKWWV